MSCETHKLYPNRDDVTLTSYLLDDSPETRDGTPRGGVLICPGGGYMFCSDHEGEPIALAFAAMGYHAFVLRYSVYAEPGEFAFDMLQKQEPRERCFFPAPMLDIAHAFLMIEDMASANLICMNKLALCGFSAGGHNAAMYATHLEDEVLLAAVAPRLPVRPAACILGYPISDYILMSEQAEDNPITLSLFMGNAITSFGTEQPSTEQLLSASPARLVSESTPMFLWRPMKMPWCR